MVAKTVSQVGRPQALPHPHYQVKLSSTALARSLDAIAGKGQGQFSSSPAPTSPGPALLCCPSAVASERNSPPALVTPKAALLLALGGKVQCGEGSPTIPHSTWVAMAAFPFPNQGQLNCAAQARYRAYSPECCSQ